MRLKSPQNKAPYIVSLLSNRSARNLFDYAKNIDKKLREYNKLMQQAASDLDFEKAMELRDILFELKDIK